MCRFSGGGRDVTAISETGGRDGADGEIPPPGPTGLLASRGRGRLRPFLVRLLASAVLLTVVFNIVDLDAALDGIRRLRPLPWAAALGAFLFLHALSALKWRFFLGLTGARLPVRTALSCHAAGLFANLCLPSLIGGDVLRAGLAFPATRKAAAVVVGSIADRVADLTALLAVAAVGLAWAPWAGDRISGPARLATGATVIVLGCLGGSLALHLLVLRARRRRFSRKLSRKLIEVGRAVKTLRRQPLRAAALWGACFAIQCAFVLVNVSLGAALGLDLATSLWFLLWPLAKIVAMLPLSLGGLGVREAAFAGLVSPFADENLAVAQSLVWQSVLVAGGLLCGAYWTVASRGKASRDR